jgi:type I restriction enzyme S subunit
MQAKINEYTNMKQKIEGEETEIGFVSDEWKRFRLGELVKYEKGRKPEKLFEFHKVGYLPYLTAEYFRGGDAKQFVDVENERSIARVSSQDIVLIWDGSKAGDVFTGLNGVLASTMVKIEPSEHLIKPFLYYFLKTKFIDLNEKTTGSTIPHVSKAVFENLAILCPPLPDQQKIAKVLNTIQSTIEQQNKIIEAAKNLKITLMQKLFAEGLGHTEFKETEIGEIPATWEVISFGDVARFKNGINFSREQRGKGILTIDVLNMYGERIDVNLEKLYRVNVSKLKSASEYLLKQGDILFVRSSLKREGVGWASLFGGSNEPVSFCGFIIRARLLSNNISPGFLTYFLRTAFARNQLIAGSEQVAITNINQGLLKNLKVPVPPFQEQQEIAHVLSTVDKKREVEERKKVTLKQLFRTMLSKLMTGEIRLKGVEV